MWLGASFMQGCPRALGGEDGLIIDEQQIVARQTRCANSDVIPTATSAARATLGPVVLAKAYKDLPRLLRRRCLLPKKSLSCLACRMNDGTSLLSLHTN